jgi:hypothetical protein
LCFSLLSCVLHDPPISPLLVLSWCTAYFSFRIWGSDSGGYKVFYLLRLQSTDVSEEHAASTFGVDHSSACYLLHAWLILRPWRWRRNVSPKRRLAFKGIHNLYAVHVVRWAGWVYMWRMVGAGQPTLTKDPEKRAEGITHSTQHSTRHGLLQTQGEICAVRYLPLFAFQYTNEMRLRGDYFACVCRFLSHWGRIEPRMKLKYGPWKRAVENGLKRGSPYLRSRVESRIGTAVHMVPAILPLFLNSLYGIPMQLAQLHLVTAGQAKRLWSATITHRPAMLSAEGRHGVSANWLGPVVAKRGHVLWEI